MTLRAAGAFLTSSLSLVACDQGRQLVGTLGELQEVRRQVAAATKHDNVTVNLANGKHLTIGIVNSPLKQLPSEQKRERAREIAVLAYNALPSRSALERVAVVFVVHRRYFLVFNYTEATDHHAFEAGELRGTGGGTAQADIQPR